MDWKLFLLIYLKCWFEEKKNRKTDSMSVFAWGSETPAASQVVLNNFSFKDFITIWLTGRN